MDEHRIGVCKPGIDWEHPGTASGHLGTTPGQLGTPRNTTGTSRNTNGTPPKPNRNTHESTKNKNKPKAPIKQILQTSGPSPPLSKGCCFTDTIPLTPSPSVMQVTIKYSRFNVLQPFPLLSVLLHHPLP